MKPLYQPTHSDFKPAIKADHVEAEAIRRPSSSYWQDVYLRLRANRQAIACLYLLVAMAVFTLAGPWLWQVDPNAQNPALVSRAPNFGIVALVIDPAQRWPTITIAGHLQAPEASYYRHSNQPPLPAPEELKVTGTSHTYSVRLSWQPVANAARYHIYRNFYRPQAINELGLPLGATRAGNRVSYEDQLALTDRTYYYSVTADDGRNESIHFSSIAVTVRQAITATQAAELGFEATDQRASLTLPAHPLGTDYLGRDMLARVLYGARTSLFIGIFAPLVFVTLGVVYGALAGFLGGWWDATLMRFADFIVALPFLLFVILFRIAAGTQSGESGIAPMLIAFILLLWPTSARLIRGQVLKIKEESYIQAAKLMGGSTFYLIFRHMLPNTLGLVLVTLTFAIPSAIFIEAFLSFIGMGVAPPTPSWGSMSFEGLKTMLTHPHELLFPALFISITVLAFNLLGDGLRDALDARLRDSQ